MHDEEMIVAISITGIIGVIIIVNAICRTTTRVLCHWADTTLKMRLVSAGMTADEIEQVVVASRYPWKRGKAAKKKEAKNGAARPEREYGEEGWVEFKGGRPYGAK